MINDSGVEELIRCVRAALGRAGPLSTAPVAPEIDERIVRMVHTELGLPELFARVARENQMGVEAVYIEELLPRLIAFLQARQVRTVALPVSEFLNKLEVVQGLRDAGFDARTWDMLSLDQLYDVDCGVTDVWRAVSEVGALVVRGTDQHGKALSLVPPIHVAILEPGNFVPDLVDLFEIMPADSRDGFVLITGPSKTADIEMQLVSGVHGPGVVQAFILQ